MMTVAIAATGMAAPPKRAAPPAKPAVEPPKRLDEAAALRAAGKLDPALEVLRVESREIRLAEGEESARLLPVNVLAADILLDQRQSEKALSLISDTLKLHESLIAANQVSQESLGPTLLVFARINSAAKRLPATIDAAARAIPLLDKLGGPSSKDVARGSELLETAVNALDTLLGPADTMTLDARAKAAKVFESLGRVDQAIAQRKGMLTGFLSRADAAKTDAATRLGQLMGIAGRAGEAIPILTADPTVANSQLRLISRLQLADNQLLAAHASLEAALDPDKSPGKISATTIAADKLLNFLIEVRRGRAEALPDWFTSTRESLSKTGGAEGLVAVQGLTIASDVLNAMGKPADAVVPLEGATGVLKKLQPRATKATGRTPPKTAATGAAAPTAKPPAPTAKPPALTAKPPAPTAKALAAAAKAAADNAKAAAEAAKAAALTALIAGPSADVAGRLAAARIAAGDATTARIDAELALATATEALGPGDPRVAFLRVVVADACRAGGDLETAAALVGTALAYGLPRPDDAWETVVTGIYDRLAAEKNQKDWRAEYLAARARQFGERHPHVAMAWSLFGAARLTAGDWPAAAECFSRSLDIQRASLGADHAEVAATLSLLAHAQRLGGDPAQAARTAADAVAAWERNVGPSHPGTLAALDVLALAKLQAGVKDGVAELLQRLCAPATVSDPVRRAYNLVRLADLTATQDKNAARNYVQDAMKLPCWASDEGLSIKQRRRLAETAAIAARAYRTMGDDAAGQMTLLKARSIALRLDKSGASLTLIEQLATPEKDR